MLAAIVFTRNVALVAAIAVLVLVTIGFHLLLKSVQQAAGPTIRRGILSIIIGADLRTSTSKVQVVLWTYAVAIVLVALLFLGRSWGCDASCREEFSPVLEARDAFPDLMEGGFEAEYLVLLGFPALAGVIAKGLTTSRRANSEVAKPSATDSRSVANYLGDIISDDAQKADLGDFQYFTFNIIALSYFFLGWLSAPEVGLPSLPDTLVALSGTSAGLYVAKKYVDKATPTIDRVDPPVVQVQHPFRLTLHGLAPAVQDRRVAVLFGEHPEAGTLLQDVVTIEAVPDLLAGAQFVSLAVRVRDSDGVTSAPIEVAIVS